MAAGLTALLRLPFVAHRLWDHDSVQFALGVLRYDLAAHQPHPPGYPLYIALLKLLAALGVEPLYGMVALSVLGAALGAGCLVLLVGRLAPVAPERTALLAAILYAANPLLWFYGELPLIYALEGGLTVAVALAAWRMGEGRLPFLLACVLFAVAAGLRQSTAVLLAPLFLYGVGSALLRRRLPWRVLFEGAALGAALVALWFVPLLREAGGYAAYRQLSSGHFQQLLPYTSILYGGGWPALAHNLEVLVKWGVQGMVPAALALCVLTVSAPERIARGIQELVQRGGRLPFLLAWVGPPVLFFAFFHVTKGGYTLVHLPALLAAAALVAAPALAEPRRAFFATLAALAAGAILFLYGTDRRPDQSRLWAAVHHEWNNGTIETYERDLDALLALVRRHPPRETVLATVELAGTGGAGADGFLYPYQRHLQWYFPEYPVLFLVPEQGFAEVTRARRSFTRQPGTVEVPAGTKRIVYVLSAPTGPRLPLGLGEARQIGRTFYVQTVPFAGEARVGSLVIREKRAGDSERVSPEPVAVPGAS
jgi:4-amino-4-deoxy-L-arabinose transferase-like glycosyltransferase